MFNTQDALNILTQMKVAEVMDSKFAKLYQENMIQQGYSEDTIAGVLTGMGMAMVFQEHGINILDDSMFE